MVDRSRDSKTYRSRTTRRYKEMTDLLNEGLERLIADQAYFHKLKSSKFTRNRKQGSDGCRATTIQISRQRAAIRNDKSENEQAYRAGDINKFW